MLPSSSTASGFILAMAVLGGVTTRVSAQQTLVLTAPLVTRPSTPSGWMPTPQYGATISGWVKQENGLPAVGYTVHADLAAYPDGGAQPNTAVTDGHGWYRIRASPEWRGNYDGPGPSSLGPKGYAVWVGKSSGPYTEQIPPGARVVDTDALPRHRATHVDFVVDSGPGGCAAHP